MDWDNSISQPFDTKDGIHTEAPEPQWLRSPTDATAMQMSGDDTPLTEPSSRISSQTIDTLLDFDTHLFQLPFVDKEYTDPPLLAAWQAPDPGGQHANVTMATGTSEMFDALPQYIAPISLHLPDFTQSSFEDFEFTAQFPSVTGNQQLTNESNISAPSDYEPELTMRETVQADFEEAGSSRRTRRILRPVQGNNKHGSRGFPRCTWCRKNRQGCKYENSNDPCDKCKEAARPCSAADKVLGPSTQRNLPSMGSQQPALAGYTLPSPNRNGIGSGKQSLAAQAIARYENTRRATRDELFGQFLVLNYGQAAQTLRSRRTRKEIRSEIRGIRALIEQNRLETHTKRKRIDEQLRRIRANDDRILENKRIKEENEAKLINFRGRLEQIRRSGYQHPYSAGGLEGVVWHLEFQNRQLETELHWLSVELGSLLRSHLSSLRDEMHAPYRALERLQAELYQLEAPRDAERIRRHRMFTNGHSTLVQVSGHQLQNALETQGVLHTDLPGYSCLDQVVSGLDPSKLYPLAVFAYILLRNLLVAIWSSQGSRQAQTLPTLPFVADVIILQFPMGLVKGSWTWGTRNMQAKLSCFGQ